MGDGISYVYLLSNPITQEPFYVGCTRHLRTRRKQHYVRFASEFYGLPPVMTVLDAIPTRKFWVGLYLERYWINKYMSMGCRLINQRNVEYVDSIMDYGGYRKAINKYTVLNYKEQSLRA